MNGPELRRSGRTWPYALGGALLLFGLVVLRNAGENEGGDVIAVLGPLAAVVGGLVGAVAGGMVNARSGERRRRSEP